MTDKKLTVWPTKKPKNPIEGDEYINKNGLTESYQDGKWTKLEQRD